MKRGSEAAGARLGACGRRALGVLRRSAVAVILVLAPVTGANALETLDFRVPSASEDLLRTLRASSFLIAARNAGHTDPVDLMAAARAEYGRLIDLLYEEAYYAPTIHIRVDGREAVDMSSLSIPRQINRIEVDIDLGPQFTFGRIELTPLAPGTQLPEAFATGQPARSVTVRDAAQVAVDAWREQGHAQADIAGQQIVADHAAHVLNLRLRVDPGPVLHFGTLRPEGNESTRSDRIVDIAGLTTGALHTPEALGDAEERLRQTGAFTSVRLRTAEHANPDGTIDVVAEVDETLPRRLGFGIEADTEAGFRLSGFWLHRNLLHGAERLRLEAAIDGIAARTGGLGFTLSANYTRPATFNRDTDLELGLSAVRLDERDYDADAIQADATLLRRFGDHLRVRAGFSLRYEAATYGGATPEFGTFGIPVSATHDTRDEPLDATSGHYLFGEVMPYAGFGAAQSGVRLRFDGRVYQRLGGDEGRVVLAGRAQLGAVAGSSLNATPRGFLFYSGGGGTVRGLPYQSLGVVGPPASGGRGFAALSGELRVRLNENFSMAAFADAGAVSVDAFSGASDWQAGGGLGIRYNTPIGPLRLDLAAPIRRNATAAGSNPLQLYLGIGQAF
ncbi:MAG: BamA/TamA family outer membrane protein [Rhodobacter sp.]|nr:BamA/TamA family outer membrane protein [Rhodobacter sp.]